MTQRGPKEIEDARRQIKGHQVTEEGEDDIRKHKKNNERGEEKQ